MFRSEVMPLAESLRQYLASASEEIQIAGSVRRGKQIVHDLEFVLLPTRGLDLWGEESESSPVLDCTIGAAVKDGILEWDRDVKRNGPKLKRLIHSPSGLIVELYIADERNFGNIFAIRTGCHEFSRGMMTSKAHGGGMPVGLRQIDGYLRQGEEIIPCRTEEEFFLAIGLRYFEPEERTPEMAARLWRRHA
jgi:DNA polymerase/3'-5' exonuclease PolX